MSAQDLRDRYFDLLMERLRADEYPSPTMLSRIEQCIRDRETAEAYLNLLLESIDKAHFPSPVLLDRAAQLIDVLESRTTT